MLVIIKW